MAQGHVPRKQLARGENAGSWGPQLEFVNVMGAASHVKSKIADLNTRGQPGPSAPGWAPGHRDCHRLGVWLPSCPVGAPFSGRMWVGMRGPRHLCNQKPKSALQAGSQLPFKPTKSLALVPNAPVPCYILFRSAKKKLPVLSLANKLELSHEMPA